MNEGDTQAWRERVTISLATIETQLKRIAADRESEKGTVSRLEQRLDTKIDDHIEWNGEEHGKLHEKLNNLSTKFWFGAGIFAALQFVAPFVWQAVFK